MAPLETQILNYFKEHPRASDTLEGILQWWLMGDHSADSIDQARHALENLVSLEVLSARVDNTGRAHYRLSRKDNGL
jgi:hypothetical protein